MELNTASVLASTWRTTSICNIYIHTHTPKAVACEVFAKSGVYGRARVHMVAAVTQVGVGEGCTL